MTLKALNAEAAMLEDFESHWKIRLSKVARGSPAYFMIQAQIDEFDLRSDPHVSQTSPDIQEKPAWREYQGETGL